MSRKLIEKYKNIINSNTEMSYARKTIEVMTLTHVINDLEGEIKKVHCSCKEPKNYYCYKCGKPCCDCQMYGHKCEECCQ